MIKYYMLLLSGTMMASAFCATKPVLDDELYRSLKETAHRPNYESLVFDKENVKDETFKKDAHEVRYTNEVVAIDHEGETLTIKKRKKKPVT